jgi:hypothetical protein
VFEELGGDQVGNTQRFVTLTAAAMPILSMMMPTTSEGETDAIVAMAMRDSDGGYEDVENARR